MTDKKGLAASGFADNGIDSEASAAAGEEPDHSSAAISAVRSTPLLPISLASGKTPRISNIFTNLVR